MGVVDRRRSAEHNLVTDNHDGISAFNGAGRRQPHRWQRRHSSFPRGGSPISQNVVIEGSLQGIWAAQFFSGRFVARSQTICL